jgi:diaminopimelate decarboxylase/aspartate kinase
MRLSFADGVSSEAAMKSAEESPWVVLKFGGTSVSSAANWRNIAGIIRARRADGLRPLVVHSALSGITDRLEAILAAALHGTPAALLDEIEHRHAALAAGLEIPLPEAIARHIAELRQTVAGLALIGEVSDRIRARVLATGELMATQLGAAYLRACGLEVEWIDARTVLRAQERIGRHEKASMLSVTCDFAPDARFRERLAALPGIAITQGFIASDRAGETVLLGRGGSDTSAAYFAAKLAARRLEIWTDVPGMFSGDPRSIPGARLLKALHYDEAQEIASNGAKVLHPRCILPLRQYAIPLHVHATQTPDLAGTVITASAGESAAQVKAICVKKNITLVSLESPGMWHQVGFLADAFQIFKDHGLSVDLVSTSETNVTVSLDPAANSLDPAIMEPLVHDLNDLCRAQVIGPCASLSLVGRNIRGILHDLGEAFELFEEQKIYLVSQAANDLNFTFVIDEAQADRLVQQLHDILIRPGAADRVWGPTWEQLYAPARQAPPAPPRWWERKRERLLELAATHSSAYVYDSATIHANARSLKGLRSIDQIFYAIKANPHPDILRLVTTAGLGLECVSQGEVEHVLREVPGLPLERILFTPNFAARSEYEFALAAGVRLTLDNLHPLEHWHELFAGREIIVRIDTGFGRGHHEHVRTAGLHSKFGIPTFELDELERLAGRAGAKIVGLHAHSGSGIFTVANWAETATLLAGLTRRFTGVRCINVGGGIGVPDKASRPPLDLAELDAAIGRVRAAHPLLQFWMEPGRYLVAESGVLLATVTQIKGKGDVRYVGIATGMNSLIRPALYGAWHEIVNLTRLAAPATETYTVVGPICESGDQLGADRSLPPTEEGDVLLIANAGAYGHVMSSHYNLRAPAVEIVI